MLSCFSSINSYFDQWHVQKQGLKTTHSSIVEQNQNNCRRKNCQTSHLLRLISVLKKIIIIFDFFKCCLKRNVLNKLSVLQFFKVEQSMGKVVFARKCYYSFLMNLQTAIIWRVALIDVQKKSIQMNNWTFWHLPPWLTKQFKIDHYTEFH